VQVSTINGTAVSANDFIIAPPPYTVGDILVADRMTPGTSKTITIGAAGKIGLILFDGVPGQRVSLKVGTAMTSAVTVLSHKHPPWAWSPLARSRLSSIP
jgi:hypothetical protein